MATWRFDDREEAVAADALTGERGKGGLNRVEPRAGCRGEVERPARVAREPSLHFGILMGPITLPSSAFKAANNVIVPWRFVVMRHRAAAARLHRQPRLRAIKHLDLALLIDRQHDRVRIPTKSARHSDLMSAGDSEVKSAGRSD
jgi:hypothetical protein